MVSLWNATHRIVVICLGFVNISFKALAERVPKHTRYVRVYVYEHVSVHTLVCDKLLFILILF